MKNLITAVALFFIILFESGAPPDLHAGSNLGNTKTSRSAVSGTELTFFVEPYQAAFLMLVPRGWRSEGGMIPSGFEWNRLDLVESNIRFRVISPDNLSFFGWYPRFYFTDPLNYTRSSGGILNPSPGEVLDGTWIYPYMSVPRFFEYIIFRQLGSSEFKNPRLTGELRRADELLAFIPQQATHRQAGAMNFECSINGRAMQGRLYTALYDLGGYAWSNIATFGLVAAKERWAVDERVMEFCIRSFRLNPEWVKRASAAEIERGKKMTDFTRKLNAQDIEYERARLMRSSDSQTEFYKVLTEQMETRDRSTGEESWFPAYRHAYTDGNGNYMLSDEPLETAPEWKSLEIINRNAE